MEKINMGYSTKYIRVRGHLQYLKFLKNKTELFVKRFRWKVFYFDKPAENNVAKTKF